VVDIIVTDRNLHRPFLFDRAVYEPTAKALGSWRTDMHNSGATGTCGRARSNGICQGSIPEREPADGHRACQLAETQTSARRHFLRQHFEQTNAARLANDGPPRDKEQ
jgi:hypothetical protein